ncbi:MAG: hypothetical protein GY706_14275 [Bacteroides sp.]|nr:hypothetical protein [Bacteroides sp.]
MQNKVSITFNRMFFSPELNIETLSQILSKIPYDDSTGIGFTKVELIEDVLEVLLLKRVPTSIRTYNTTTESFEDNDIFIFEEIDFYIDIKNNFIYTFGSAAKLNKAKNTLKAFVSNQITYENIDLSIDKALTRIELENWQYDIKEITIKKFVFEEGASGKFVAKIHDQPVGRKLIEEYISDIPKVILNISSEEFDDFELSIGTSNSLSIKCVDEDTLIFIESIKKVIV